MRRFKNQVAYDPETDPATWTGYNPIYMKPTDPLKRVFSESRKDAARRRTGAKAKVKFAERRAPREVAEEHAAQVVRSVVSQLEQVIHLLNDTPAVGNYLSSVNQKQIHNAIVQLKTKCGVKFDLGEFAQREKLD